MNSDYSSKLVTFVILKSKNQPFSSTRLEKLLISSTMTHRGALPYL